MNNPSSLASFTRTHIRLIVCTLALISIVATGSFTFFLQQRTSTHAASSKTPKSKVSSVTVPVTAYNSYNIEVQFTFTTGQGLKYLQPITNAILAFVPPGTYTIEASSSNGVIRGSTTFTVKATNSGCDVAVSNYGSLTSICYPYP